MGHGNAKAQHRGQSRGLGQPSEPTMCGRETIRAGSSSGSPEASHLSGFSESPTMSGSESRRDSVQAYQPDCAPSTSFVSFPPQLACLGSSHGSGVTSNCASLPDDVYCACTMTHSVSSGSSRHRTHSSEVFAAAAPFTTLSNAEDEAVEYSDPSSGALFGPC